MNKKVVLIFICAVLLTGCGSLQRNQIKSVEELETEMTMIVKKEDKLETLNGVDKQRVKEYIDDSHFYDEKEGIDFLSEIGEEERYHITILDAWYTEDLEECGEYFLEDSKRIMKMRHSAEERFDAEDIIYLCVKLELTNKEEKETEIDMGYFLPWIRIPDDRLVEYGLPDAYVDLPVAHTELRYDYEKKKDGKSYYFFDMQPGETTAPITILYLADKKKGVRRFIFGIKFR